MTDVLLSPRDQSCWERYWEGGQEPWPVRISAPCCLLTMMTVNMSQPWATLQQCLCCSYEYRLWSPTDQAPLCLAKPQCPHLRNGMIRKEVLTCSSSP